MWSHLFEHPDTVLPDKVSEDMYLELKAANDPFNWLTAYVGFGMSFGGKMWGGYARNSSGTDYAGCLKRSVERKIYRDKMLAGVRHADSIHWITGSYNKLVIPDGSVVYLDPPYRGRTKQTKFAFNHDAFWMWATELSERCCVFVTEFILPDDWVVIHNFGDTVVRHHSSATKGDGTTECLAARGLSLRAINR